MSSRSSLRSPLRYEIDLLAHNIRRLRDHFLNRAFDLTLEGARRRKRWLIIILLAAIAAIGLITHPLPDWLGAIRDLFMWSLNAQARHTMPGNPITNLIVLAVGSVTNLMRFLAILVFPYMAAVHFASLYLADIFEKPSELSREFLGQVALGGGGETAVIENGEFLDKDESRIHAIGGPGYVQVDRNSAALFEKSDGCPHVIGPTIHGSVRLDGFERFRSAIDLRDQHIDLRDQEDHEIASRSLDGIPVSAIDISLRFSIWRGAVRERSLVEPNPFKDDQVIQDLVYDQEIPVIRGSQRKDTSEDIPSPIGPPVVRLIRGAFSRFMSERKLSEFLASYGSKEVSAAQEQARSILEKTHEVIPPGEPRPEVRSPEKAPDFTPRPDISAMFNEGFATQANRRGVQLDWLGVGTWKTPVAIVPEHHLEAWKLSMDNAARGSESALQGIARDAELNKTIQVIQNVPLARFREIVADLSMDHPVAVKKLLISYREQMAEARALLAQKENERSRALLPQLDEAIDYVNELLGWKGIHYVGGTPPGEEQPGTGEPL